MQRVVEMFPKFKEGKGEFSGGFAEAFTRRCGELDCSSVALSTFGNFAKYNLPLTLPAARLLLESLGSQPTSQTLLATSLFQVYKLTPITHDLPSAALLAATCYDPKHRTEDTLKIAEALMPHIQKMLEAQSTELVNANTAEDLKVKKLTTMALRRLNFLAKQQNGEAPFAAELVPSKVELQKTI
ncbi:hypothetical protein CPB83DRAFT_861422 [Crepidotus variabilis]|uniref:Uncharacterized protein n=1 Tax=Crepidotus variabilis TaxID=179855 RepID=A0A9P6E8I9_9AGAR|nr:hypothetical protein CPB83DRAFT_861422 [Crepidotus variabilis]